MTEFVMPAFGFLALMVVMGAWVFRRTDASLLTKMVIPSVLLVLAYYAPKEVNGLLGTPRVVTCEQLPPAFEIIAFTNDREGSADLFINAGTPRLFEINVSPAMDLALQAIRAKLMRGPVHVTRTCEKKSPSSGGNGGGPGSMAGETIFDEQPLPMKGDDE